MSLVLQNVQVSELILGTAMMAKQATRKSMKRGVQRNDCPNALTAVPCPHRTNDTWGQRLEAKLEPISERTRPAPVYSRAASSRSCAVSRTLFGRALKAKEYVDVLPCLTAPHIKFLDALLCFSVLVGQEVLRLIIQNRHRWDVTRR